MRVIATCVAAMTVVAACGSAPHEPNQGGKVSRVQPNARMALGCRPQNVAAQFGGFLNAVSARARTEALRHVAGPDDLMRVTIYHGTRPGEGRVDAETPATVFQSFAATIPKGQLTDLLVIAVGDEAPFSEGYENNTGVGPTAGVEVVARIGNISALSGKIGIDCDDGRMYVGAMQVSRGLSPRKICGKYIRIDQQKPVLCKL